MLQHAFASFGTRLFSQKNSTIKNLFFLELLYHLAILVILVQPCRPFLFYKTLRIQAFSFTSTLNCNRGCFCRCFSFCFPCLWKLHGDSIDRRRRATACFSQISWDLRQRLSICSCVRLKLDPPFC
jgi:hypothetical protein